MIMMRLRVRRVRAAPAGLAGAILALRGARQGLGNPADRWIEVPRDPVDEWLRCRRVRILDEQGEAFRARGKRRPCDRRHLARAIGAVAERDDAAMAEGGAG